MFRTCIIAAAGLTLATNAAAYQVVCQDGFQVLLCDNGNTVPCSNGGYQIDCQDDYVSGAYTDACGEGINNDIQNDIAAVRGECLPGEGTTSEDPIVLVIEVRGEEPRWLVDCGDGTQLECNGHDCQATLEECSAK